MNRWAYKNDTADLIELCNMIRGIVPDDWKVEREWFWFYDENEKYLGYSDYVHASNTFGFRNPDVMVLDEENNIIFCHELDGHIHVINFVETDERNENYKNAGIEMLITEQNEKKTNDFITEAYNTVMEFFN